MTHSIRPARTGDSVRLIEIERAAGERFRAIGMPEIAEDDPGTIDELDRYAKAGRSWVAVDADDRAVGYLLVDVIDGHAHVEQVSVLPQFQGRGVGRSLLDMADRWARQHGLAGLTLTTFRDVPWNGPLYGHLGFRELTEGEIGPELLIRRAEETAHGLDPATRICMRRPLSR